MSAEAAVLDREVAELLRDEPELLAIADAVVATQPRPRRRSLLRRFALAASVVLVAAAAVMALPGGEGESATLERALAAIGTRPVIHAQIEALVPTTTVVALGSGRVTPRRISIEYWFDERRGQLRTVVRHGGVVAAELLETRAGAVSEPGTVRLAPGARPGLDPALAGFVTRYRDVLANGDARVVGRGDAGGREVVRLELGARGTRERVTIDAETYRPVEITPLRRDGRPSAFSWRVVAIETVERVEADFARPRPRPPLPFRGDVRASRPISSLHAVRLRWPALWLGQSWRGLRLISLEHETLTRGYPPGAGRAATRADGLRVRYGVDGADAFVEISQAPYPEPAYGFAGGAATFDGNPIPPEGELELIASAHAGGRARPVLGQLRRGGVYVSIWGSTRALVLAAARGLRPIGSE